MQIKLGWHRRTEQFGTLCWRRGLISVSLISCLSFLFEIRGPIGSALHVSLHPFTRYIFIKVYTESCHCTAKCKFQLFSTPELRSLNVPCAVGNTGSPTPEIVTVVRSIFSKSLVQVKNDRHGTRVLTIIVTKTLPCLCDRSLLETLSWHAFLISTRASHVESNSHCE